MNRGSRLVLIVTLLGAVVVVPRASAQEKAAENESSVPREIAAARCAYTGVGRMCAAEAAKPEQASRGATLAAQFPRRMPARPTRPARAYPGGGYPATWASQGNGRHALIGAVIGFGVGAALGAKANTDQHPGVGTKAAVLVGCVGALLGAAIGGAMPSLPSRRMRHNSGPDEDQEASGRQIPTNSDSSTGRRVASEAAQERRSE